ncbi:hypothetical protein VHEMI01292 [[Torrubiella] hemipterigena]|uniref:Uncharacterized protein n=1 Tax=[Torrubiella] hemipterigena TaxID=1531966 RepID=A0A0A1T4E9_9HYPO|nr:hypothetical protein VHEMI01292 [[Torrubiella] hemipterigena]
MNALKHKSMSFYSLGTNAKNNSSSSQGSLEFTRSNTRLSFAAPTSSTLFSGNGTVQDRDKATAMALLQKYSDGIFGKRKTDGFTAEQANPALIEYLAAPQKASSGVVSILLSASEDINYSTHRKNMLQKERLPTNIVQNATADRLCPWNIWTLVIGHADTASLYDAFAISVENNMVARVEKCLQVAAQRRTVFTPALTDALRATMQLVARDRSESRYLSLVLLLLKNSSSAHYPIIAQAKADADAAGYAVLYQMLHSFLPGRGSISSTSASATEKSRSPSQSLTAEDAKRLEMMVSPAALEQISLGYDQACDGFLAAFKEPSVQENTVKNAAILGDLLQHCAKHPPWLLPKSLQVIATLLSSSSFCPNVDAALYRSLTSPDLDSFDSYRDAAELLAHSAQPYTVNLILDTIPLGLHFKEFDLWRLHSLLEWGATAEHIQMALCLGLHARVNAKDAQPDALIQTLVGAVVDLEPGDGGVPDAHTRDLCRAISQCGNSEIMGKLQQRWDNQTKSLALAEAIVAKHDERVLLAMVAELKNKKMLPPFGLSLPEGHHPHLFLSLLLYPKSQVLLEALLKKGCSPDAEMEYYPSADFSSGVERITPLILALCQLNQVPSNEQISPGVIDLLVEKSNVNYQTERSMVTPLILAAKHRFTQVAINLLRRGAKPSPKDCSERSALFYASRNGDVAFVKALLAAGAPVDDGSLHEAARELHDEVAFYLMKKGASIQLRSTIKDHNHRTAWEEFLLQCNGNAGLGRIEATIRVLKSRQPLRDDEDFFMALDNPAPQQLLRALLNLGLMRLLRQAEMIKKVQTQVHGIVYYYSPTKYIEHDISQLSAALKTQVLGELRAMGCRDEFYAQQNNDRNPTQHDEYYSVQPKNFVPPPPILASEKNRVEAERRAIGAIRSKTEKERANRAFTEREAMWQARHTAAQAQLKERAKQEGKVAAQQADNKRQKQAHGFEMVAMAQSSLNAAIQKAGEREQQQRLAWVQRLRARREQLVSEAMDTFCLGAREILGK